MPERPPSLHGRLRPTRAGYAPRRRPNRFVRKLKRLATSAIITALLIVGALIEAEMIVGMIEWGRAYEQARVERVASDRVAQECGRAR